MSDQEWWTRVRKAAEFWREIQEHQMATHGRNNLNNESGAVPSGRNWGFGSPMFGQLPKI